MKKKARLFIILILSLIPVSGCGEKTKELIDDIVANPASYITSTEDIGFTSNNPITDYPKESEEEVSSEETQSQVNAASATVIMENLPLQIINTSGVSLTNGIPQSVTLYESASEAFASPIPLTLTDYQGTLYFSCTSKTQTLRISEIGNSRIIETDSSASNSAVNQIDDIYTFSVSFNNQDSLNVVHIVYELKIVDSMDNTSLFYLAFAVGKFTPQ